MRLSCRVNGSVLSLMASLALPVELQLYTSRYQGAWWGVPRAVQGGSHTRVVQGQYREGQASILGSRLFPGKLLKTDNIGNLVTFQYFWRKLARMGPKNTVKPGENEHRQIWRGLL